MNVIGNEYLELQSALIKFRLCPDGTRASVANQFSDSDSVIAIASNTENATVEVGSIPFGVA
jgi:YVTN family beta-propeller protein